METKEAASGPQEPWRPSYDGRQTMPGVYYVSERSAALLHLIAAFHSTTTGPRTTLDLQRLHAQSEKSMNQVKGVVPVTGGLSAAIEFNV